MQTPTNRQVRTSWRRGLFWIWVVASALVALYIGIAEPLDGVIGSGRPEIALALPALMFFMLATGLGWLVLLVTARRR